MATRPPIILSRVRRIEGGFAFIPNRFLHDGFITSLTAEERSLYLFLVLAADRNGMSYYGFERICAILEMPFETYHLSRNGLIDKDLLAFDGLRFQILSLPEYPWQKPSRPLKTWDDFAEDDPATIRKIIREALPGTINDKK